MFCVFGGYGCSWLWCLWSQIGNDFTIDLVCLAPFSIKLGVMEDHSNRTRLAKLLRFQSSNNKSELTSLADYVERMKEKQDVIYFMAGSSRDEVSDLSVCVGL